ncbi:hypothetical protein [Halorientalis regularis]|jgi:hypothetical protein|uniref:Uncharacterized protein n=1 Tax=Halorientalis regularis TaxID=660518 RepID=A0A1G7JSG9_9EURY|nr:hypothetical protein [Halorientalis regularis]SDF27811.1 hypothetical protein SAMN05216218_10546 [Halorientalis regularis]
MTDQYPTVGSDALERGPWELRGRSEDTVFQTPTATVRGHTLVYDDADLRAALDQAGVADSLDPGGEGTLVDVADDDTGGFWRFFFATALSFRPPLAPGIGPASMRGPVVRESRESLLDDLRSRGFERVEAGRRQRVRTDTGDRATLTKVTATYPLDRGQLDVEGWIAVWSRGGSFRIAGGAYPTRGLATLLDGLPEDERPEIDPGRYRDDLLGLIRAVE